MPDSITVTKNLVQYKDIQDDADSEEEDQREHEILLDASRLDDAQFLAGEVGDICRAVAEESVDEGQIKIVSDPVADALRAGTEEVQDAVNEALVHHLVDDLVGEPNRGFDEDRGVNFIHVIFILEEAELKFVFGR